LGADVDLLAQILKWAIVVMLVASGVAAIVAIVLLVASLMGSLAGMSTYSSYSSYSLGQMLHVLTPGANIGEAGSMVWVVSQVAIMLPALWLSQWVWKAVKYVLST